MLTVLEWVLGGKVESQGGLGGGGIGGLWCNIPSFGHLCLSHTSAR